MRWLAPFVLAAAAFAQTAPVVSAKASAPGNSDFLGYWVAHVSEDWRWRMVTPPKGDFASIPINMEARKVGDAWDPARDEAAGEQCRSYGAPAILRVPGRLRISWQNDNTLRVETDAGQQTRLLHFGGWKAPAGPATWQGDTVAEWNLAASTAGKPPTHGSIKTTTTHLRPGYLRKNGVPYSTGTLLTEFWDVHRERNGAETLVVTIVVHDPAYLQQDWITAQHFKREPDAAKWDPQPCSARW